MQHPRTVFIRRLFDALGDTPFCAVGDTRQLPDAVPSDLDLVVEAAAIPKLPRLLSDLAGSTGNALVNRIQYQADGYCFIVAGSERDRDSWFLSVDCSCGYAEAGRLLLDEAHFLDRCRPAIAPDGGGRGFPVPAPAAEFIYYLLKKIEKQQLEDSHARHLTMSYRDDPEGARAELRRFWRGPDADLIARAAAGGDWSEVRARLPALREALHAARSASWAARLRELRRLADRILHPTGLWVVFLGPDGSGKSTLLDRVAADIAPALRGTRIFHLRAELLTGKRPRPVTDPHGRPPRGAIASLAQLMVNLVRCQLGYWLHVWPALVRSSFVGFDRYFHDVTVDPRRYRYGGPRWLAKLACGWVPQPDLWILLDAPAAAISARKGELPAAEIERQRLLYRELIGRLSGGHVVDASRSIEEVAHAIERIIIDFLAGRTARRLRLVPRRTTRERPGESRRPGIGSDLSPSGRAPGGL